MKNKSITKILIGLFFTYLNISFLNINIYTQIIGIIFLIAGTFQLKKEDKLFLYAHNISICSGCAIFLNTLIDAIGFNVIIEMKMVFMVISYLLMIVFSACLFQGLAKLALKTRQRSLAKRFSKNIYLYLATVIILLVAYFISFFRYIAVPIVIILYLIILSSVYNYRKRVHKKLFNVKEKRLNIKFVTGMTVGVILLVVLSFFSLKSVNEPSIKSVVLNKNDIEEISQQQEEDVNKIKNTLITSGFPETILADLPNTEILLYSGVKSINVTTKTEKNDEGEIELTSVVATLADNNIKFLEHYKWLTNPKNNYIDLIGVSVKKDLFDFTNSKITANHMFEKEVNGNTFTYSKKNLEPPESALVLANKFRNVKDAKNQRGYITFTAKLKSSDVPINNYITAMLYTHQMTFYNMPYEDIYSKYNINKAESNHSDLLFQSYILKTTEPI
ncbi:MAG: hypothetical protein RR436_05430 [Clostridia bacterium]